ncbi:MAG TPA: hypothetical protein VEH77_10825 [Roseiarcus sp.]|nr:hypothetical protein [Roseiarcus sp.]
MTNAGTIGGGTASVVFNGSGANTLTLQTGSTLNGAASGSAAQGATNALILQGHGAASNNFLGFNTLTANASGGAWTLAGNSAFGDTTVSSGTLTVTGSLTSKTLEIKSSAQLTDSGAVFVNGAVTNSGNLTINGVTMHVSGAGGTFAQLAGGTTTLLNGGVLDPSQVVVDGGVFGGGGGVIGDVSVNGATVTPGAKPGDSLEVVGDYSQNGGEIAFDIDPNGVGGFLETRLGFEPTDAIDISHAELVFDFSNGANPDTFIADGLFNLDTFFGLSDGGGFCAEVNCGAALQDLSYSSNISGLIISGFDSTTGKVSVQPAPEPPAWMLLVTGVLALAGFRLHRRKPAEARISACFGEPPL